MPIFGFSLVTLVGAGRCGTLYINMKKILTTQFKQLHKMFDFIRLEKILMFFTYKWFI